jgi:hypothetical protein
MDGNKVILPIWHKITKQDVLAHSPSLADKVAFSTDKKSVASIAKELAEVVRTSDGSLPERPTVGGVGEQRDPAAWVEVQRSAHGTAQFQVRLAELTLARQAKRVGLVELRELRGGPANAVIDAVAWILV